MTTNQKTTMVAPLSGLIVPITDVPDPTFAEKMLGDGIAIDPMEETLVAPVDGTITNFPSSHHALTLTTADGIEILMHIGLETVVLKGQGFTPLVKEGDVVKAGTPLISFDAAFLVDNASSLLTMIVITAGKVAGVHGAAGSMAEAGVTPLLDLVPEGASVESTAGQAGGETKVSAPITILNPAGLHARPAGVLVNSAKQFSSSVRLIKNGKEANAKSVGSIMGLEVLNSDVISLSATGPDADAALAKLVPLIQSGLGEALGGPVVKAPKVLTPPPRPKSDDPNVILGVSASPGIVTGQVFQLETADIEVEEKGKSAEEEKTSLLEALKNGRQQLVDLQDELRKKADTGKAAIFAAHTEILEDPELLDATLTGVGKGQSAAFAWKKAYQEQADTLANLGNELLAARANDIRDVGHRVLSLLTGHEPKAPEIPANAILIADNLTPSDTAGLDKTKVLGFATVGGSSTSHVAILARSASLPAIAAVEERALQIPNNTTIILDGSKGKIQLNPSKDDIARIHAIQTEMSQRRKVELAESHKPAITTDNQRVKVVANIGGAAEAKDIPELGGEGVGLLRSEFLFLQRENAPSIEEQSAVYATIAKILGMDRDLVVRTLDVGGDKPLAYLPLPVEENPFLGVRGIRVNLIDKELLIDQIKAILAAAPYTKLHIMFPMVSTAEEIRGAKAIVQEQMKALGVKEDVQVGMMVEVPVAAVMAEQFAREVDFFSIGTNDLTQYTMAVDRGNPRLASMADGLHPGVLNLIGRTVRGAHKHGKWVGVCGGLASEIEAVPVLVGLGVDELSVSVSAIPTIKAAVRRQSLSKCRALAEECLNMMTAKEVRERVEKFMAEEK